MVPGPIYIHLIRILGPRFVILFSTMKNAPLIEVTDCTASLHHVKHDTYFFSSFRIQKSTFHPIFEKMEYSQVPILTIYKTIVHHLLHRLIMSVVLLKLIETVESIVHDPQTIETYKIYHTLRSMVHRTVSTYCRLTDCKSTDRMFIARSG